MKTKIATLKTQATHLVRALGKQGISLTRAQSLEAVAAQYGFDTWDALVGMVKAKPSAPPTQTMADLEEMPQRAWVEGGSRRISCDVHGYEYESIRLLDDLPALEALFDKYPGVLPDRMETEALFLCADGRDFHFTLRELQGLQFQELGPHYVVHVPSQDTYLEFEGWAAPQVEDNPLAVPALEKSALGCSLVTVPSSDGYQYDAQVIVPASLNAETVAEKLSAEIARLKEVDENGNSERDESAPELEEYTEADLVAFAAKMGCKWVLNPTKTAQTWD